MLESNGFVWDTDENGEEVARPTENAYKRIEENRFKALYRESGLPLDKIDNKLRFYDNYDSTISKGVRDYIADFQKWGKSNHLYIHGPQNTGKTTAVAIIGKELLAKDFSVKYIIMNELLILLQKGQFDDSHKESIERLLYCDLLILDQCFQEDQVTVYKSGYQIPFLDSFLKSRMEVLDKTTIFVSNVDKVAIPNAFRSTVNFVQRKTESVLFNKTLDIPDSLGRRIWK